MIIGEGTSQSCPFLSGLGVARPRSEPRLLNRRCDQPSGDAPFITVRARELRTLSRVIFVRWRAGAPLSSMLPVAHHPTEASGPPRARLRATCAPRSAIARHGRRARSHIFLSGNTGPGRRRRRPIAIEPVRYPPQGPPGHRVAWQPGSWVTSSSTSSSLATDFRSPAVIRRARGSQPTLARCSRSRSDARVTCPAAAAATTSMWWRSQFIGRRPGLRPGMPVMASRSAAARAKSGSAVTASSRAMAARRGSAARCARRYHAAACGLEVTTRPWSSTAGPVAGR